MEQPRAPRGQAPSTPLGPRNGAGTFHSDLTGPVKVGGVGGHRQAPHDKAEEAKSAPPVTPWGLPPTWPTRPPSPAAALVPPGSLSLVSTAHASSRHPFSGRRWRQPHFLENLPRPPRLSQQPSSQFRFSKHLGTLLSSLCNFPLFGWLTTGVQGISASPVCLLPS